VEGLKMDNRLKGAKIFQQAIVTPVAISEDGNIDINPSTKKAVIFNLKDVTEYTVIVDETKNTAGSIGKGVLLGGLTGLLVSGILGAGGTNRSAAKPSLRRLKCN
jgi:hypothetical protein